MVFVRPRVTALKNLKKSHAYGLNFKCKMVIVYSNDHIVTASPRVS